MCSKCSKNFFSAGKMSGQIAEQTRIIKLIEELSFIWMGEKQAVQIGRQEIIQKIKGEIND